MPETEVRAFRGDQGEIPIRDWLNDLEENEPKAHAKRLARILELAERGNQMRRPHADYLRGGIYELRASSAGIHYRILYFFFDKNAVALSHGLDKEDVIPPKEIDRAITRMKSVKRDPDRYTADLEIG